MRREKRAPRANWRQRCEEAGFPFHSMGGTYWDEAVCYAFSADEVDRMEEISAELHQLCLKAADEAVRSRRFAEFAIPEAFHELVAQSWRERDTTLYGPPYYASSGWSFFGRDRLTSSPNAMDATRLTSGSVASSALSARATRMGLSGGGSSGVSRGGFGSSGHASSSSGS